MMFMLFLRRISFQCNFYKLSHDFRNLNAGKEERKKLEKRKKMQAALLFVNSDKQKRLGEKEIL